MSFMLKLAVAAVFAFPLPLLGWYFSLSYILEAFSHIWMAPWMLMLCVSAPYLACNVAFDRLSEPRRYACKFAYLTAMATLMIILVVFKKKVENLVQFLF